MTVSEKDACLKMARNVGVFKLEEIKTLSEVIEEYLRHPDEEYFLFLEKDGDSVLGLIIFAKTPITQFAWDIYWLVVAKEVQGKGFGKRLIKKMEDFILLKERQAILRVETSTKHEFAHARNLYVRCGFSEVGRIPSFYTQGDDLIIYYKQIPS